MDVRVKLGIIKLLDQRFDVCEKVKEIERECPIEKGEEEISHTVDMPKELPFVSGFSFFFFLLGCPFFCTVDLFSSSFSFCF